MESNEICFLASQVRASAQGSHIFTLSVSTLSYLLSAFELIEEQSTSFNVKQPHNFKAELVRDLQYLHSYVQQTKTLKLYGETCDDGIIDIAKFRKVIFVEFYKVNVNRVKGLQILRPQLRKLVCQKTFSGLDEILSNCGGDNSQTHCWDELKEASFVSNSIVELDHSLECAPWLHTLDLSHNELTSIETLSCLPNLKYLNLSYNKLEVVAQLKGQICSRLQNLSLKNNFIEDISGLRSLTNLCVLDLSNNCLVDHKSLLALSNIATLQWLNLQSNPLSFHPKHRIRTASYLHVNTTASTHFVLNNVALTKNETRFVGSYYPLQSKNNSFATESINVASDKVRRVREVVIEDANSVRESQATLAPTPKLHLETKKQVEDLHEKFGESWLNSQSGLLDVLGLENFSVPLSTSPYQADFTIYSGDFTPHDPEKVAEKTEEPEVVNEEYDNKRDTPDSSLDEVDVEGEESIYLATIGPESDPIFLVIGHTHFSERECSTGDEREKWHLDSIISCDIIDEERSVQMVFETMRKDKKQRLYVFEEEIEAFVDCIKNKINSRSPKRGDDVRYQCMKCSRIFAKIKSGSILGESAVKCPYCDSTIVVEDV